MNMKKNDFCLKLKTFFTYEWWKCFILLLIGGISIPYLVKVKTALKDHEVIHLFVAGELKDNSFNKDYLEKFDINDGILEVRTTALKRDNSQYQNALQTTFGIDCDFIIVPESDLQNEYFTQTIHEFDEFEIAKLNYYNYELSELNNKFYGVKIFDKNVDEFNTLLVNNYFDFIETSYIFIDKTSTNLTIKNGDNYSSAFDALLKLLQL